MTDQELAECCATSMWQNDLASQHLGMEIIDIAPGKAVITMEIRPEMANGHGTCQGGFIFALADSGFAFACNTYNQVTVSQCCNITYIRPATIGDQLTAHAREISRYGRSGIYDVRVTNQAGQQIAEFRGHSRTVKGVHLPDSCKSE